ncbi:hypothetical protein HY572_06000 [Candidatus Micrarchaeota archaeon]|nr:hypothetical protein [Candidatus Micrarchaeota archaeon]
MAKVIWDNEFGYIEDSKYLHLGKGQSSCIIPYTGKLALKQAESKPILDTIVYYQGKTNHHLTLFREFAGEFEKIHAERFEKEVKKQLEKKSLSDPKKVYFFQVNLSAETTLLNKHIYEFDCCCGTIKRSNDCIFKLLSIVDGVDINRLGAKKYSLVSYAEALATSTRSQKKYDVLSSNTRKFVSTYAQWILDISQFRTKYEHQHLPEKIQIKAKLTATKPGWTSEETKFGVNVKSYDKKYEMTETNLRAQVTKSLEFFDNALDIITS